MIDYSQIWTSINAESERSNEKTQIARKIPSKGATIVFLATDLKRNIRLMYIMVDNSLSVITETLPRFKGLEISSIVTSIGQFKNKEFLKFTQLIPNTENIFESVISDICDKVIQVQNIQNLSNALVKVLNEWKLFFHREENGILSVGRQKGLVGELYFLKDYLFGKYSYVESLSYWTGYDMTNHDFQIINNAVEIKTTSSKQHKRLTISSERQLDSTGLDHLYLVVFSLNLHSGMPEKTLPALVREIYLKMQGDPVASFQFQLKLIKYGYNEAISDKYTIGFSISEIKFFEVLEDFPRLLQQDLPPGIGDLKYSIVLSACAPFEMATDINNYI